MQYAELGQFIDVPKAPPPLQRVDYATTMSYATKAPPHLPKVEYTTTMSSANPVMQEKVSYYCTHSLIDCDSRAVSRNYLVLINKQAHATDLSLHVPSFWTPCGKPMKGELPSLTHSRANESIFVAI